LRKKIPALRAALTAFFTGHHAIIVGKILSSWTTSTRPSIGSRPRSTG
jgi:hypothetical protein